MIPNAIKMPLPFEYVFPRGALFLGVDAAIDFDKRGQTVDDQARDPETGMRLWTVSVMDLDPEAGKFGRSKEVKVKVAAEYQPVPPPSLMAGIPPLVEFTDLTATPYTDSLGCKGGRIPHKCRARQAWSLRATGIAPAGSNAGTSTSSTRAA
jgi:hypothetical protein